MTIKKSILILIILIFLVFLGVAGLFLKQGIFRLASPSKGPNLVQASPSPCPSPQTSPPILSEETKKILSQKENFQPGLAETYKEIPLYPGIKASDVWTFLKPAEGILYTASASKAELISFYQTKLKEKSWLLKSEEKINENTTYSKFIKENEKILNIFVSDKIPDFLPKELGLKGGTYISLHFSP